MKKIPLFSLLATLLLPVSASAHEVYVLSNETISTALATPRFEMLPIVFSNIGAFLFWASVTMVTVVGVFFFSISRRMEKKFSPWFEKMRPWAPLVGRVTIGISFLAAALFQANYGPELPLSETFGSFTPFATALLTLIGVCITFGFFVRGAAFIALAFFAIATYFNGWYMLTYLTYLGEIIVLILLGAHKLGSSSSRELLSVGVPKFFARLTDKLAPYSFLILRVTFGISVIYSALYAKIIHNNLALAVAADPLANHLYGVAHYLGFEAHFLVLGAAILEVVLGICFVLGIEIRFFALFLEFWLGLSLYYFGESVWPHLMLFGIPLVFFLYGYDKYSLEGRYFKKGKLQPVL